MQGSLFVIVEGVGSEGVDGGRVAHEDIGQYGLVGNDALHGSFDPRVCCCFWCGGELLLFNLVKKFQQTLALGSSSFLMMMFALKALVMSATASRILHTVMLLACILGAATSAPNFGTATLRLFRGFDVLVSANNPQKQANKRHHASPTTTHTHRHHLTPIDQHRGVQEKK